MTSTRPYGSLATMVRSSARPTYSPWPLPRSANSTSPGGAALAAPMATDPSKVLTVRRKASTRSGAVSASRDTRDGITLASVVIGAGNESCGPGPQVGVVVDVAVERGDHVRPAGDVGLPRC